MGLRSDSTPQDLAERHRLRSTAPPREQVTLLFPGSVYLRTDESERIIMKKLIGLGLWLLALLIPFRFAILDTEDLLQPDGSINNMKGLISFLVMIALIFTGYALVDSAEAKPSGSDAHKH